MVNYVHSSSDSLIRAFRKLLFFLFLFVCLFEILTPKGHEYKTLLGEKADWNFAKICSAVQGYRSQPTTKVSSF